MIKLKHSGLQKFYETDSKAGILPAHAKKPLNIVRCCYQSSDWISRDGSCIL